MAEIAEPCLNCGKASMGPARRVAGYGMVFTCSADCCVALERRWAGEHPEEAKRTVDAWLVALDETHLWEIDEEDKPRIKEIRGLYLLDRNQCTRCCELTPSYDMRFVCNRVIPVEGVDVPDDVLERWGMEYEQEPSDTIYIHCRQIDGFITKNHPGPWVHHHDEQRDYETADEHEIIMDDLWKHYCCNPTI